MRKLKSILFIFTIILVTSCSPLQQIANLENDIKESYNSKKYNKVLSQYEELEKKSIQQGFEIDKKSTLTAGKAAFKLEDYNRAARYFTSIEEGITDYPDIIYKTGISYQKRDDTGMEQVHWHDYLPSLKDTEYYEEVLTRLFAIEAEMENYHEANELWKIMPSSNDSHILKLKLLTKEATSNKEDALQFATETLNKHGNLEPLLFWKAKYYYNKAEDWYQNEMAKYNENPDYTAYAYLRRELRKISKEFRTARDIFIELREINPNNTSYINYLRNTYSRLSMREEAAQMDKLLQEERNN
ncbi:hypothetical protein QA597_07285 [Marinilabiliaceae bacterium ANBcel2]|nr:hypothetical protein [Marinilabiliaceae bacterium ANBcel2]